MVGFVAGALGAGLGWLLMTPYRRRRFVDPVGGRDQAKLFRTALRSGRVAERADLSRWQGYVDKELSPAVRRRGRIKVLALPFVLLLVLLLVVGSSVLLARSQTPQTSQSPDSPPGLLAFVVPLVLLVFALGLVFWGYRQRLRRLERLQQRLGDAG